MKTFTRNPGLIAELSPYRHKYPPTFYSSKIVQTTASGFELIADGLPEPEQWMNNLKSELGMPTNALLRHLTTEGAAFGPRWQTYHLRFLGIVVEDSNQEQSSWPFWRVTDAKGTDIELVQVWFQRVSCISSPVYGDVRWHPEHGKKEALINIENRRGMKDVKLAVRGLTLLNKINFQGRPINTGYLTPSQFTERAPQAYRKLLDKYGEKPSAVDIAAELYICRATFYRYMDRDGLSLKKIRDIAMSLNTESHNPF